MHKLFRPMLLVFLAIVLHQFAVVDVFAGPEEYRQCADSGTCEIGEYLFNDDYTPIASASCTLKSTDPDGNTFLNDVAMTAHADGWYSYDVSTDGEDYGMYRSQICCTYQGEYLCLDKSFEIASSSATANVDESQIAGAVWSHPARSLTSFGTLVSDIWSYSSRSLSSFSSLVTSIWSSDDRSLTSPTIDNDELATKSQVNNLNVGVNADFSADLTDIKQQLQQNRYYLELLVNEPIIETFIEEGKETPDLQSKIEESRKIARSLGSDVDSLNENIIVLNTTWQDTDYQIALNQVTSASRVLGASTQVPTETEPSSINSKIAWLNKKWKTPVVSNLGVQTTSALANINGINREIKSYGKTFISQQYLDIATQHVEKIEDLVGKETDPSKLATLFGFIKQIEETVDVLIEQSNEIETLLSNWNEYTESEKDLKLLRIKETVLSVNQIEDADTLLKTKPGDEKHRENLALALNGLIESNLIYLATDADTASQNTWLEHGSVVFRSLITNPSDVVSQVVQVKYYLPQEINSEHVLSIDDGLSVNFDAEKNALAVTGEFELKPEATKTVRVEVIDVWEIPEEEIESIRKQTETLFDSLKGTSYFAQGATIKADIEVNLDRIEILKEQTQTPELKIKSHREAMLELNSAKTKLENLKTIVSSAGSIDTVFGFVGGVQAIAVWGLIVILIAGFVFLMIYLKTIAKSSSEQPEKNESEKKPKTEQKGKRVKQKNPADDEDVPLHVMIRDIIAMKFGAKQKPNKRNHQSKAIQKNTQGITKSYGSGANTIVIAILALIVLLIAIILIVFAVRSATNSEELISPVPDSVVSEFDKQFLNETFANTPTEQQNATESTQLAQTETFTKKSGLVLGDSTAAQNDSLDSNAALEKGTLARAQIPDGYQAINVRSKPEDAAALTGRLYINQDVYILEEKEGWVFIKTTNITTDEPILGWILKKLVTEIQQ